jgi:hypothetical protein
MNHDDLGNYSHTYVDGLKRRIEELEADVQLYKIGCERAEAAATKAINELAASDRPSEVCEWTYDDCDDKWDSSCGMSWQFMDGGPKENNVTFCHHCGCEVKEAASDHPSSVTGEKE